MCGIFAYLNYLTPKTRWEIIEILIKGLQRLEYRGYDSAGIGIDSPESDGIYLIKASGRVKALENAISSKKDLLAFDRVHQIHCGIAHTRWATHGPPNEINSHPHRSDINNEFIVVHNGIITNYKDIKRHLENKGYKFESDTDTEIIAKLIKHIHSQDPNNSFRELVEKVIQQLEGAFSLCFKSIHFPGECVATRRGSPLMVGIKSTSHLMRDYIPVIYYGKDNCAFVAAECMSSEEAEFFIASDASAIVEHTDRVIVLEDDDVVAMKNGILSVHRLKLLANEFHLRIITILKMDLQQITKGNFSSFMQKEIFEQPESVINTMRGRVNFIKETVFLGGIKDYIPEIRRSRRLLLIGCGTSYLAGVAMRQLLEELSELPVMVDSASDLLDRNTIILRDDVCIFISQSGETADTLQALRYCKSRGAVTLGVTNVVGSSISRESHAGIHINAGPEIGVGSTKAYTSQLICLVMFALVISEDRVSIQPRRSQIIKGLGSLADQVKEVLSVNDRIAELTKELYFYDSMLVMGRGYNYATCLEGALKIKEVAYIHSEGLLAGAHKHLKERTPVIVIATRCATYSKCIKALQQNKEFHQPMIVICDQGDVETQKYASYYIEIPHTIDCLQGILTIIPLQLLTYHLAVLRGCNVDFPRNLAKSSTVE